VALVLFIISTDYYNAGEGFIVAKHRALHGSGEVVGFEFRIHFMFPNPLDEFRTEETIALDSDNFANHVAAIDSVEIEGHYFIAYFHFQFPNHLARASTIAFIRMRVVVTTNPRRIKSAISILRILSSLWSKQFAHFDTHNAIGADFFVSHLFAVARHSHEFEGFEQSRQAPGFFEFFNNDHSFFEIHFLFLCFSLTTRSIVL